LVVRDPITSHTRVRTFSIATLNVLGCVSNVLMELALIVDRRKTGTCHG
jgi:hypothetical protein